MTSESDDRFDQVKHGDKQGEGAYPDNSGPHSQATGHGSKTPQVRMQSPEFVAMSEDQRRAAVEALAELLVDALDHHDHGPCE